MKTLHQLKEDYLKSRAAINAERQREKAAREQEIAAIVDDLHDRIIDYLAEKEDADPSELKHFSKVADYRLHGDKVDMIQLEFNIENHALIRIPIRIRVDGVSCYDSSAPWTVDGRPNHVAATLGQALAVAAQQYKLLQEQERLADEQEAAEEASYKARQAKERQRESAKQRLFDRVTKDPVALMLLKIFVDITEERQAYQTALQSAEDSEYYLEEFYSRKLSEVRSNLDRAERDAQDARYEAEQERWTREEAESKEKKLRRSQF